MGTDEHQKAANRFHLVERHRCGHSLQALKLSPRRFAAFIAVVW
jgi:hypothetical protein